MDWLSLKQPEKKSTDDALESSSVGSKSAENEIKAENKDEPNDD